MGLSKGYPRHDIKTGMEVHDISGTWYTVEEIFTDGTAMCIDQDGGEYTLSIQHLEPYTT